jgi:hypothetical protein
MKGPLLPHHVLLFACGVLFLCVSVAHAQVETDFLISTTLTLSRDEPIPGSTVFCDQLNRRVIADTVFADDVTGRGVAYLNFTLDERLQLVGVDADYFDRLLHEDPAVTRLRIGLREVERNPAEPCIAYLPIWQDDEAQHFIWVSYLATVDTCQGKVLAVNYIGWWHGYNHIHFAPSVGRLFAAMSFFSDQTGWVERVYRIEDPLATNEAQVLSTDFYQAPAGTVIRSLFSAGGYVYALRHLVDAETSVPPFETPFQIVRLNPLDLSSPPEAELTFVGTPLIDYPHVVDEAREELTLIVAEGMYLFNLRTMRILQFTPVTDIGCQLQVLLLSSDNQNLIAICRSVRNVGLMIVFLGSRDCVQDDHYIWKFGPSQELASDESREVLGGCLFRGEASDYAIVATSAGWTQLELGGDGAGEALSVKSVVRQGDVYTGSELNDYQGYFTAVAIDRSRQIGYMANVGGRLFEVDLEHMQLLSSMRYRDVTSNVLMTIQAQVDATEPHALFLLETLSEFGLVLRRIRTVDEQSEVLLTISAGPTDIGNPVGFWLEVDASYIHAFFLRWVFDPNSQMQRTWGQYVSYNRGLQTVAYSPLIDIDEIHPLAGEVAIARISDSEVYEAYYSINSVTVVRRQVPDWNAGTTVVSRLTVPLYYDGQNNLDNILAAHYVFFDPTSAIAYVITQSYAVPIDTVTNTVLVQLVVEDGFSVIADLNTVVDTYDLEGPPYVPPGMVFHSQQGRFLTVVRRLSGEFFEDIDDAWLSLPGQSPVVHVGVGRLQPTKYPRLLLDDFHSKLYVVSVGTLGQGTLTKVYLDIPPVLDEDTTQSSGVLEASVALTTGVVGAITMLLLAW